MSAAVGEGSGYVSRRRRRQLETDGNTDSGSPTAPDDEASKRREERKREREARRRAREDEEAAEEEKRKSDRDTRRKARRGGDDEDEQASHQQAEERRRAEEEERQRQEEEEARRHQQEAEELEQKRRQEEEEEEERKHQEEEEEERRHQEEEDEEDERRYREEQKEAERRRRREEEEEEEEVDGEDEPEPEEPEEESIFDQMSPQKKQGILEGLAAEFHRIVDERDAKGETVTSVTPAELDELDLKVRSLRTQLRKADELKINLQKQYKEMEVKINLNAKEVTKLRTELTNAEAENELAVKEGRKVVTQRTTVKKGAPKKGQWGGFVNVVRKAQSAAWEDKFKAMKAKQKESGGPEPEWMSKAKKAEGSRTISPLKKDKGQPEKGKPAWAQQQVLRGGSKPKAPWDDKEEKREDKPSWASGGLLKKTEKGDIMRGTGADAEREKRRQDWREQLKKSGGVKSSAGGEKKPDEPAFKNISLRSVRKSEADDED